MVLQTINEEFTSMCINVLDVVESSMMCKGNGAASTIFNGINCHPYASSATSSSSVEDGSDEDAQRGDGVFKQHQDDGEQQAQPSTPSSVTSRDGISSPLQERHVSSVVTAVPTTTEGAQDHSQQEQDVHNLYYPFFHQNHPSDNKDNEQDLLDLSMSSYLHPSVRSSQNSHQQQPRRHHRRHDSSMSAASTVSQAMFLPSDDDIFRVPVITPSATEEGADGIFLVGGVDVNNNNKDNMMKLERCTAFSQDSTCDIYPCYPMASGGSSNKATSYRPRLINSTNNSATVHSSEEKLIQLLPEDATVDLLAQDQTTMLYNHPLKRPMKDDDEDNNNNNNATKDGAFEASPGSVAVATTPKSSSSVGVENTKSPACVRMVHWDELVVGDGSASSATPSSAAASTTNGTNNLMSIP